jgi:hypothetical protein
MEEEMRSGKPGALENVKIHREARNTISSPEVRDFMRKAETEMVSFMNALKEISTQPGQESGSTQHIRLGKEADVFSQSVAKIYDRFWNKRDDDDMISWAQEEANGDYRRREG